MTKGFLGVLVVCSVFGSTSAFAQTCLGGASLR